MTIPQSAPLAVPVGADTLSVTISGVELEDGFPELAEVVRALTAAVVGKRVTVAQLYAFAYAVEQAYAAEGYVLVRVVVPPQELVDGGIFKLVIVDGFIEEVDVGQLSVHVRSVVAGRSAELIGRRRIKLAEIERRVILAGEIPGLRLRSTLVRGREEGGTRLVLEGAHKLAQGSTSTNNFLDEGYGRWQYSKSGALNSVLGYGEQIYATYSGSDDLESTLDGTAPLRVIGGGAVIPLGNDGLTLNPEYTQSRARPLNSSVLVLNTEDIFERYAMRLAYPVLLTRTRSFHVQGIYEYIRSVSEARDFDVELDHDRYSVGRLALTYNWLTLSGNPLLLSATFSQGLGGRSQEDALLSGVPLSRQGAQPDFQKLQVDARYIKYLPESFRLDLIARAQTSFGQPLLQSEQMTLDSPEILSGFDLGTFSVDRGASGRIELSRPWAVPHEDWVSVVTPYTFAAYGHGSILKPTIVEQATVRAGSYGVGVRAAIEGPDQVVGGSVAFEAARHYSDDPSVPDGYRGSFSAGIQY